jgi:predicted phage-related endonuclease
VSAAQDICHQEWLAKRRLVLGASEVAFALGLAPDSDVYTKPIDVWLEKTGAERVTPINRGRVTAGNKLEPVVRDWYRELTGEHVESGQWLRHPEHEWIGCTPDSLVIDKFLNAPYRNVQIKCVGARASFAWPGISSIDNDDGSLIVNDSEGIPQYYRVQCEWEMGVLSAHHPDIAETHLVALLGGTELRVYRVERDRALWEALFEAARNFWFDHVVADVPPPPDGSEAFKRFLARRYPQAERVDLDLMPANVEEIARRYLRAREIANKAEDAKEQAANELRDIIGAGAGFWAPGIRAAWRNTKKGRTLDVRETG